MKNKFIAYRLDFLSALHVSNGKPDHSRGQDTLHSDTLKSALFSAAIRLFGEEEIDRNFLDSFRISSAFPYIGERCFFPKPQAPLSIVLKNAPTATASRKRIRKIRFLDKELFEAALRGDILELGMDELQQEGAFASRAGGLPDYKLFHRSVRQKVTMRESPDNPQGMAHAQFSTPYFIEEYRFGAGSGLYFLVWIDPNAPDNTVRRIDSAMDLLSDEGIGASRSRGMGHFSWKKESLVLDRPNKANASISLSLHCPSKEDFEAGLLDEGAAWSLMKREGYIAQPRRLIDNRIRKSSIYMFAEGSVFPVGKLGGTLHDLQPKNSDREWDRHPVWRDGRPLNLPFVLPQSGKEVSNG